MASVLNTKINSFAIENGIEFSQAYALVPNQTGTNTETSATYWAKSGRNPVFESGVNPPNGSGSWRMLSDGTDGCYHRTNGGNIIGRFRDHDYSAGVWIKVNALATGINVSGAFWRLDPTATSGFEFGYTSYADGRPSQFYVRGSGSQEVLVGAITLNTWYFLSVRKVGTTLTHYINGQLINTQTRTSTELQTNFAWGNTVYYQASFNICNMFVSSSTAVDPVDFTDIYITGMNLTETNISVPADPMTCTAAPGPGHQRLQQETVKASGLLHKKIHSYPIQTGIEFNSNYSLVPVQTGTVNENNTSSWGLLGNSPQFNSLTGPNGGKGSWYFPTTFDATTNTGTQSRIRNTAGTILSQFNDYNISTGFWFKYDNFPLNLSTAITFTLFTLQPTSAFPSVGTKYNATTQKHDLVLIEGSSTTQTILKSNMDNSWHYFAYRRSGTTRYFYLNGQLVLTKTDSVSSTDLASLLQFGYTAGATGYISNFYLTGFSDIDDTAIAQIWDIGNSQALQKLSSNVNNQITSYDLLRGIRFQENYKDPYTQIGTVAQTTESQFTLTGNAPVYEAAPTTTTEGGWAFTGTNSLASRVRDAGTIINQYEWDGTTWEQSDYSTGFWAKINTWPTTFSTLIRTEASSSNTEDFYITYGVDSVTGKKAFIAKVGSGAAITIGTDLNLQTGEWYYFALRKDGYNATLYLNGLLVASWTLTIGYPSVNINYLTFGHSSALASSFTISNFYLARQSVIGPTQIQAIWNSRNTLNFNETVFPLTADGDMLGMPQKGPTAIASALMTDPVIAATIGDSTNISTSITGSALMVDPTILTGQWILIPNIQLGTADALQVFPFNIETNLDKTVSVLPCTASALFPEPLVAQRPFIASALFVNPTLNIDENYFQKVMELNPLIYINDGKLNPTNYGSMEESGYTTQYLDFEQLSTQEMQAVNNTTSWKANSNGIILHEPRLQVQFPGSTWADKLDELYASRRLSIEFWYYSIATATGAGVTNPNEPISEDNFEGYKESGSLFSDGITDIAELYDYFNCGPLAGSATFKHVLVAERIKTYNYASEGPTAFALWRTYYDANPNRNDWNHVVITHEPVADPQYMRRYVYVNGALVGNELLKLTFGSGFTGEIPTENILSINTVNAPSGPIFGYGIQLGGSKEIKLNDGVMFDEFAYYPITLTAAQVLDHYSFVKQQSPDETIFADGLEVTAVMGQNNNVLARINFEYDADPITALAAQIPQPVMTTGFDRVVSVQHMFAQAFTVDPEHSHGSTISHTEFVVYAELPNAFHLNTIYYDYVQANIAPYRYVTFDSSEPYLDYGTDTDYSVANFVINGTVVNPDLGINGKSVKSTGTYTNGAIVFKESEHLDNWGTGPNSWHTSFWMQRALDDNSTGLRVLWNANGYADNQNIIIYHYQNKLHVQINSQNDLPITMSTPNNVNVFDFGLHHIVLNSHHNNNQNTLTLYVDGLQVATQNIGTYQIELTNGSQHVGANSEANNFPRLGIGTLITPFVNTALPVVPTNISVYFDEIYWDKNGINAGQVATLFGMMPGKVMAVIFGDAMTASAQSVMPALTTTALYLADPMTASAESGDHTVLAVLNNVETAAPMTASALMLDAARIDNTTISAAFMFASAIFNNAGTPRIVRIAPFNATAELANRRVLTGGITVNGIKIFDAQSPWVQFIKITNESSLLPMDGVR